MQQPIAYSNGEFIPQEQLHICPQDLGFMWGVTVAEQLRTFRGKLFQLDKHLTRLSNSLATTGVAVSSDEIAAAAKQVIEHNFALIDRQADLGLTIFVTPGLSATYSPNSTPTPNVGIHSYPLPFTLWAHKYSAGQACEFSRVPQVSAACWPRALKSRSRMHYYLADAEVGTRRPAARAILLDDHGCVNEASTANVVAYFAGEGMVSPPLEDILPGISLQFLESLTRAGGDAFSYRPIMADELARADEIFLTSTPFCLLPVSKLGDRELLQRTQFHSLLQRWSAEVDVDIRAQAESG